MLSRFSPYFLIALINFATGPVSADCTSPAGKESAIIYNADYHTYQFCNDISWIQYQSGYSWGQQSTYNPTIAPGSGFFVLTKTTYNGNLGGLAGADSKCLTDLTTNTGWRGYATANSNGQLVAGKVHAFLCNGTNCNNLTALTTYNFANVGNDMAGGAVFTTDGSGNGPQDSADWAAANYFSGIYSYWMNRAVGSNTVWSASSGFGSSSGGACSSNWTTTTGNGVIGNSSQTTSLRWFDAPNITPCTAGEHLICYVDP